MDPLTIMAVAAAAMKAIGKFTSGFSEAQALDAQRKQYKINAQQSRWAAEQAYAEGAMAVNQQTDAAIKEIAQGVNAMSAAGNVGTSAQAALLQGYFNLGKDVSAINYKYDNEAIQHKNAAAVADYNAKIAEKNRKNRIISQWIGLAGDSFDVAKTYYDYSGKGSGGN